MTDLLIHRTKLFGYSLNTMRKRCMNSQKFLVASRPFLSHPHVEPDRRQRGDEDFSDFQKTRSLSSSLLNISNSIPLRAYSLRGINLFHQDCLSEIDKLCFSQLNYCNSKNNLPIDQERHKSYKNRHQVIATIKNVRSITL